MTVCAGEYDGQSVRERSTGGMKVGMCVKRERGEFDDRLYVWGRCWEGMTTEGSVKCWDSAPNV